MEEAQFIEFIEDPEHELPAQTTNQLLIDIQARMGQLLDLLPVGLAIHQQQGILFANQQFCRLLGENGESIVGRHLLDYVVEDDAPYVRRALLDCFEGRNRSVIPEMQLAGSDGVPWIVQLIVGALPWDGTPVLQVLAHDITRLRVQERRLQELAETDPLTGPRAAVRPSGRAHRRGGVHHPAPRDRARRCARARRASPRARGRDRDRHRGRPGPGLLHHQLRGRELG